MFNAPRGNYYKDEGWDASIRIFKGQNIGPVIVSEWEYSISGGGVIMDEEAINTAVQGNPAIIMVREDDSGNAETVLTWADESRAYIIEINKYLAYSNGSERLNRLAISLSNP